MEHDRFYRALRRGQRLLIVELVGQDARAEEAGLAAIGGVSVGKRELPGFCISRGFVVPVLLVKFFFLFAP